MAYTTINKSTDYFNTKLYTGNSTDNHTISGVGFQPDFLWIKDRGRAGYNHRLQDSVRGATKSIQSNRTVAEATLSDAVKSFNSDGFVLGNDAGNGSFNGNSPFVSWNWKANGTGVANTDGSISSTVSANATSGFSIVSFTGTGSTATVGHGLGSVPKWIIVKSRGVENWRVYSSYLGATKAMLLNGTNAEDTDSTYWNNVEPTSSLFTVGTNAGTNGSSVNMIAYCFSDKTGYSKFGSYTGNGSTDGTFVYTGFKPAFFMVKATSAAQSWQMVDNKRDTFNAVDHRLQPNESGAESTSPEWIDFCSNGFKLRNNDVAWNGSGTPYIYMAFAEAPLVGTNGVTAKAR